MNTIERAEKERKFLLKSYPDILNVEGFWDAETIRSKINQYYLEDESRIRKETIHDKENGTYRNLRVEFTHTFKEETSEVNTRKEITKEIDLKEFSELQKQYAVSEIRKQRETVKFDTYNLVIDSFININLVLMEIEVIPEEHGEDGLYSIGVPDRIAPDVIMEVSPFGEFKNKNLAVRL